MKGFNPSLAVHTETLGAVTASSRGTQITAGSSNAKGTALSLGTSTFAYEHVLISMHGQSAAADYLVDIQLDNGSAARWTIAADLRIAGAKAANMGAVAYSLPLRVPAGSLVYARCGASTNSATTCVTLAGFSSGIRGMPGYSRCVALFTPGTSRGFAWDPGGTANTDTGWQQVSAGVTEHVSACFAVFGTNADVARATGTWHASIGAGSVGNQVAIMPAMIFVDETSGDQPGPVNQGFVPCDINPSSAFWIRGTCSLGTAGDRTMDVCLYGMTH
jgi:hypothetical protein